MRRSHPHIPGSAILSAVFLTVLTFSGCTPKASTGYTSIDGFAQGSTYHMVIDRPATGEGYNIPDSLELYFSRINRSLSGYDSTSIVSRINRGENPELDPLFIECFNLAKDVYEDTEGTFDISAAPLFDIWGFGFKNKENISQQKIDSILQYVGMDKLSIEYDPEGGAAHLKKADPRMKVNFNAIAQGYTSDYIGKKMEAMGIENYLLEIGGEILCRGVNAKGKEWSIGIDKPLDGNFVPGANVQAIIRVSGKGVVTSGNYRKFYIVDGEKFSHTIDPKTGRPVQHNLLSATVVAPTSSMADAYATYLMVLGVEKAREFVESRPEMEALLVYGEQDNLKTWSSGGIHAIEIK